MAISSPGIGSGLDINGIISKLMQVEQQPLIKLSSKEASYQSKISALGSLQGSISTLNSALSALALTTNQTPASKFVAYRASVGESSVASATATATSVPGSYSLSVSQLATSHRISTTASPHTLTTFPGYFESGDDSISEGTLSVTIGEVTTEIVIDENNATLSGLQAAINNSNAGITAEIIEDGEGGVRLSITSNTAGTAGIMTLDGLDGFSYDPEMDNGDLTQDPELGGKAAAGGYASVDAAVVPELDEGDERTLELSVGGGSPFLITINENNNTLAGLRDAINASGSGVTASLATVGPNDVRLVLSSNTIGNAGRIKLAGLEGFSFDSAAGTGELSEAEADGGQAAQGARIKLNGVTINSESNTITDAVAGVTLTLSKVTTTPTTLTVNHDTNSTLNAALGNIAKAYSELNKTIRDLGAYNAETKQGGPLLGNSTLRTASTAIRNVFQSAIAGTNESSYKRLSDLGLEIQKDGSMTFNSSKLSAATSANFESVGNMLATFGKAAKSLTDGMLGTEGTITAATDGAKASIKSIDKQRETLSMRLTQIEARYKKQFSALDTLIASMNTTSSYLTQQLSSLSNLNSRS